MLVLVLCVGASFPVGCKRPETDTDKTAPTPSGPGIGGAGMNVLLVSVDTTRADHLGCYGHPTVKTPNVDRLAAEGTRFAWCISSAPLTLPSHSTMLTGSYPFVHGARDNGIFEVGEENVTLAEIFKQAGYATHAEVAAVVLSRRCGLAQGFDSYGDVDAHPGRIALRRRAVTEAELDLAPPRAAGSTIRPEPHKAEVERKAEEITARGIERLSELARVDKPFFIVLHYFDPHWPHEAPDRFASRYEDGYCAEIAYFDEQFGALIQAVRDLGLSDKTLVILTSDHGEGRGQHGEYTHSNFLYDTTLHVPLILWCPGEVPAGQIVEAQVRLVDLAPTVLEFARLRDRQPEQMQGTSLVPLVEDPTLDPKLDCYSDTMVPKNMHGYSPLRSVRADGWKYVLSPRPELYHVAADPLELFNLATAEPERAAAMQADLWQIITDSPRPPGSRATRRTLDEEEIRKLQALGYLESGASGSEAGAPASDSELDHFEPVGINPREHIEEIELLASGMGSYRIGRYEESEKQLRRFLRLAPDHAQATSLLGAAVMAQDRHDEALEQFRRAVTLQPDRHADHRAIGLLLSMRGEFAEAEKAYRRALDHGPGDYRSHFELGRALAAQRRFDEALQEYAAAAKLAPQAANVRHQQGVALRLAGRLEEAIVAENEALRLDPGLVRAHIGRGAMLRELNRTDQAIELLSRAIKTLPDAALLHHQLAACYTVKGRHDQAGIRFARVVALLPDSAAARQNLAANLIRKEEHAEAIAHLRKALELRGNYALALYSLAGALEVTHQLDEATRTYERLLRVAPRHAAAYPPAARLLARQGDRAGAIELLRRGHSLLPDDPDIANDLAWRLATCAGAALRNGPEAVRLAERANEMTNGENINVLNTLAAAYAEAGRFEEAIATTDRALALARQVDDDKLVAKVSSRRRLYTSGEAYHEP